MSLAEVALNSRMPRPALGEKIRVAVIGCGAIAEQMHLPVLAGHKVLELTALVDRDLARVKRFADGYGVEHRLDDVSRLTRDIADAAIVATPPAHHAPCTLELIRKGIHVLVEKPMATSLVDAEQLVAEADAADVVLSVGFFRRLNPSTRLMKALLGSDLAGRPLKFIVRGGGMYNWPAATLGNMRREMAGGGVLMDFGTHMLDLMFSLFDEPADVLSYEDNCLGGVESDCSIDVQLRFAGHPVVGRIELARTRNVDNLIRVECERATLELQVSERFRIRVVPRSPKPNCQNAGDRDGGSTQRPTSSHSLGDRLTGAPREYWLDAAWSDEPVDESWYATFGRQFHDWIEAIQTGGEPALSGRSALATSRLIEACYRRQRPMPEPWVWRGIPAPTAATTTFNGQPKAPGVHPAGRGGHILVTGASGFIGCRVVELLRLREKCDVRAVVHNPGNASRLARLDVDMVQGDLGIQADAQRLVKDCDAVIHCAIGTAWGEPRKIAEVTVNGTRRLAEAAITAGVKRFVHVSTMSVYGDDAELAGLIDEAAPVRPMRGSVYSQTKARAEQLVLKLAKRGLPGVVFRPARVFGPFSNIFITRPLQAIAKRNFKWLGTPDVPADMVYVDNVAEALLCGLWAEPGAVAGQAFNIGAGDALTWREFYDDLASRLGLDLSATPEMPLRDDGRKSVMGGVLSLPARAARAIAQIVASPEFKSLGRRVLNTDPIGTAPRMALERFPALERTVRAVVKADDSLPVYQPEPSDPDEFVCMGSGGSVLSIEKLRERCGFIPPVSQDDAIQLTIDWVRHARIV